MSIEKLEAGFLEVRNVIKNYKALDKQNADLKKTVKSLREKVDGSDTMQKRMDELEEKLKDARRTKKTLQKVEALEEQIETLTAQVQERDEKIRALEDSIETAQPELDSARRFNNRLNYMAQKLQVKIGNMTTKELLGAIEDSIRKLVQ